MAKSYQTSVNHMKDTTQELQHLVNFVSFVWFSSWLSRFCSCRSIYFVCALDCIVGLPHLRHSGLFLHSAYSCPCSECCSLRSGTTPSTIYATTAVFVLLVNRNMGINHPQRIQQTNTRTTTNTTYVCQDRHGKSNKIRHPQLEINHLTHTWISLLHWRVNCKFWSSMSVLL